MVKLIVQYDNIQYPHRRDDTPADVKINELVDNLRYSLMQIDDAGKVIIELPFDLYNLTDRQAKIQSKVVSFNDMNEETQQLAQALIDNWQMGR